jgi:hypothetical protein
MVERTGVVRQKKGWYNWIIDEETFCPVVNN